MNVGFTPIRLASAAFIPFPGTVFFMEDPQLADLSPPMVSFPIMNRCFELFPFPGEASN